MSIIATIGKVLAGPLLDAFTSWMDFQSTSTKVQGDIHRTKTAASAREGMVAIQEDTEQLTRRPMIMKIAQAVLWGIALVYYGGLIYASVYPNSGLVVQALPTYWELLTLAILAGLAGPYVLSLLRSRFTK